MYTRKNQKLLAQALIQNFNSYFFFQIAIDKVFIGDVRYSTLFPLFPPKGVVDACLNHPVAVFLSSAGFF